MTGDQLRQPAGAGRTPGSAGPGTPRPGPVGAGRAELDLASGLAALRGLLDRPLASYYLLLSSAGLLLVIGLTMVFSATSVKEYAEGGNAFGALAKQTVFAVIGLVAFWVCQRLPARTFRALGPAGARPGRGPAAGAQRAARAAEAGRPQGRRSSARSRPSLNWLHLGPVQLQPSELAKFGLVLWGADLIARKGAALGCWRELAMPLFPVVGLLFVLVGYNDLGTMLCLLALVVGLLWAAGVRLRVFATLSLFGLAGIGLLIAAASGGGGSGTDGRRQLPAGAAHRVPRTRRPTATRTPATSCGRAARDRRRRLVRGRAGQGHRQVGLAADGAQRLHLRGHRRGAGRGRLRRGAGPVRRADLQRAADRPPGGRPVPAAGRRRGDHLAGRPGDHQHRRGDRVAADHRPAAAVHLRRRQRAGGHPRRDRHARLVRPRRTGCGPSPERPSAGPMGAASLGPVAAAFPGRRRGTGLDPAARDAQSRSGKRRDGQARPEEGRAAGGRAARERAGSANERRR